jgi:hypothetical protein
MFDQLLIFCKSGDSSAADQGTATEFNSLALFIQQFMRQEGSAQSRMYKARQLEQHAVAPIDEDWQCGGMGFPQ